MYDCVCVLDTQKAVDAYLKSEVNLGADLTMATGPVGGNADISTQDVRPMWTYTKSQGLYGGLTVDGTIIKEDLVSMQNPMGQAFQLRRSRRAR